MPTTLDYAINYYARRWMPLWLPARTKNPGRTGWQKERLRQEDLAAVFSNGNNISLLLGDPSKGLCDADLDGKEAVTLAPEFLLPMDVLNDMIAPTERRYIINDSRVEKVGELLNQNPRGLLLFRNELVGWLRTLDRDGHEGDRAFYLEAWKVSIGRT